MFCLHGYQKKNSIAKTLPIASAVYPFFAPLQHFSHPFALHPASHLHLIQIKRIKLLKIRNMKGCGEKWEALSPRTPDYATATPPPDYATDSLKILKNR